MQTVTRIREKMSSLRQQLAILQTALENYERDEQERLKACARIQEIHERSEPLVARLEAARKTWTDIALNSDWVPGDPGENPMGKGGPWEQQREVVRQLEKEVKAIDTEANQVFYGKA